MPDFTAMANGGIAAIKPYQAGKPIEEVRRELGLADVIKLASNENPFGMSPKAAAAAHEAVAQGHVYPDAQGYYLKQKITAAWGYGAETLTLGAGSNELINLLFQAYVRRGLRVVLPAYSFVVYGMEACVNAAEVTYVPLRDWQVDTDALLAAVDGRTRMVALANPSNPIGTAVPATDLKRLLTALPEDVLLVIDEAYNEFYAGAREFVDTAAWVRDHPNLVVSRTFSKAYGLAGLRVGYMVANPEITSILNRVRAPFNVNAVALAAATAALDDQEHLRRVVSNNTAERARYAAFCGEHQLTFIPSAANFVTVDFAPRDAARVADYLLRHGVIVRPLAAYGLPSMLRITIGTPQDNDRCFTTLTAALRECR